MFQRKNWLITYWRTLSSPFQGGTLIHFQGGTLIHDESATTIVKKTRTKWGAVRKLRKNLKVLHGRKFNGIKKINTIVEVIV